MKIEARKSSLSGSISVPGSKSHTIRAVAVATAAEGVSLIRSPLISGDTLSSLKAAEAVGASCKKHDGVWEIKGTGGDFKEASGIIDMGNSGTSLRIFSGLAATSRHGYTFDGDKSLRSRPMGQLLIALENLGAEIKSNNGKCPVSVKGPLKGGFTEVDGSSSQFLTSLLFASPLANEETRIKVLNLNEKPYVEITLKWLESQDIKFTASSDMTEFTVFPGQSYRAIDYTVPADFSTATFPLAAAAVTGSSLRIMNLDFSDKQGDKEVFSYFEKMGMKIERNDTFTDVSLPGKLRGAELDLNSTPDALPAMAVAACFAEGKTVLGNVPQARIKETDRISCMTSELRKLGANVTELDDGMIIEGGSLKGTEVEGYDDHRIVMALAIAGLASEGITTVNGSEAAAVTYPAFVDDFSKLGADFKTVEGDHC